jgi:hypothetical protein
VTNTPSDTFRCFLSITTNILFAKYICRLCQFGVHHYCLTAFIFFTVYIYEITHLVLNEMLYQVTLTDLFLKNVIYFVTFFENFLYTTKCNTIIIYRSYKLELSTRNQPRKKRYYHLMQYCIFV